MRFVRVDTGRVERIYKKGWEGDGARGEGRGVRRVMSREERELTLSFDADDGAGPTFLER